MAATDGPLQVPAALEEEPHAFEVMLVAEPAAMHVEAVFLIAGGDAGTAGRLRLHVNAASVGSGAIREPTEPDPKSRRSVVFLVPAQALRDGCNSLVLRSEGESVTVESLDVRVTCS